MADFTSSFGQDSVHPVPRDKRSMGFFSTFSLWVAANVVVTTVFTGMLLVPDLPYLQAIAIILLGSLVGGVALALTGNIGMHTGLPTMILTRGAFGHRGAASVRRSADCSYRIELDRAYVGLASITRWVLDGL
nr:cytosine permease [Kyrpidia tusciae]